MDPKLVDVPPAGDDWLHELKFDGYRTQLIIDETGVRAFTSGRHDWSAKYQPIVEAAASLSLPAIIDGEVAVQDESGVTQFGELRSAIFKAPHRLVFFAFDLLHLNGQDLREWPLEDRRDLLHGYIEGLEPVIAFSESFDGEGADFFAWAEGQGLEGIVSKRKGSRYMRGTTDLWQKTKCWTIDDFDVIGVKKGDDGLPYALFAQEGVRMGAAIVSLPNKQRDLFWRYVETAGTDQPSDWRWREKNTTWLPPGTTATVRFLRGSDRLRHASIKDLRISSDRW